MFTGPRIFNDYDLSNMLWYIDTSNLDCWDGSSISSNTKFYNLAQVDGSEHFLPYTTGNATSTNYELSRSYIQRKYGTNGTTNTNFKSNVTKQYFTSATTGAISAFVFLNGALGTATNQGAQNIYLGGAQSRISFALAGSGTSQWGGVLIYGQDNNNLEHTFNSSANLLDGNWHSLGWSSTASGGDTLTTKTYVDGILTKSDTRSISDTDDNRLPYSSYTSTLGGWSNSYGEFTGKYNNWMYFNTELDATDFQQLHKALKTKFNEL